MNIEHLRSNFEKRKNKREIAYELNKPATDEMIKETEERLGVSFHSQIKLFYKNYNGLKVKEPALEIFPLEKLIKHDGAILFATVNNNQKLYFDIKEYNQAGQWNIIAGESGYVITLTFASFWSNKIWAWIDKKRMIWMQESFDD